MPELKKLDTRFLTVQVSNLAKMCKAQPAANGEQGYLGPPLRVPRLTSGDGKSWITRSETT